MFCLDEFFHLLGYSFQLIQEMSCFINSLDVHAAELSTVILSVHRCVTLYQKTIYVYIAVRQCFEIS